MSAKDSVATPVLVWRSGGEYGLLHVQALVRQLRAHWPAGDTGAARPVVLTDEVAAVEASVPHARARPLTATWHHGHHGWWAKMEAFDPAHDDLGPILLLDLDTLIVGDLGPLATMGLDGPKEAPPVMLRDFYRAAAVQSGLMWWRAEDRAATWAEWVKGPRRHMRAARGDGEWLDQLWRPWARRWQDVLPGAVVSYKVHVRPRPGQQVPEGAAVVCYHGRPRPWNTPLWARYAEGGQ